MGGGPELRVWFTARAFGVAPGVRGSLVTRALRRAVLARAQREWGEERLPVLLCGHEPGGGVARGHDHLHCVFDRPRSRLFVLAPDGPQTRPVFARLQRALHGFDTLKAGAAGILELGRGAVQAEEDPILGAGATWRSSTPYTVNHHRSLGSAREAVRADLEAVCRREGLPEVEARVMRCGPGPRGLSAFVELRFVSSVQGPLVLGRTRHLGGGLFARAGGTGSRRANGSRETLEPRPELDSQLFGLQRPSNSGV